MGDQPVLSAFDPGSRRMGWCVGDGNALPEAGAWRFEQARDDLGLMLIQLDEALNEHIDQYCPEACAYEAPILTRFDKLANIRKTYNLGGHVEFICRQRGILCHEVNLFQVKKELAGMFGAKKGDMVAAAEKLGVALPLTQADGREDAADALGVWLCLLRARSPKLSAEFDRVLWGSRGAML